MIPKLKDALSILGIVWSVVAFVGATAFFLGGQWNTWKDIRESLDEDGRWTGSRELVADVEALRTELNRIERTLSDFVSQYPEADQVLLAGGSFELLNKQSGKILWEDGFDGKGLVLDGKDPEYETRFVGTGHHAVRGPSVTWVINIAE